jgi:hypothetical protein
MKKTIAVVLCALLSGPLATGQTATSPDKPSVQQQIVEIPAGSVVEVRLKSAEKLRGRLDELSADGFAMKLAKGNQAVTRQVAFDEVKSVKRVEGGKTKSFFAGVGIFWVAVTVIGLIVVAATGKPLNN